jgi:hypothetical protein
VAERVGFEPTIRLPVCRISSAVPSTTRPPLQAFDVAQVSLFSRESATACYRFAVDFSRYASVAPGALHRQRALGYFAASPLLLWAVRGRKQVHTGCFTVELAKPEQHKQLTALLIGTKAIL